MIWTIENIKQATTLSESSITRMVRAGTFPRPSFIGRRRVWKPSDVEEWAAGIFEEKPDKKQKLGSGLFSNFT